MIEIAFPMWSVLERSFVEDVLRHGEEER